MKKFIQWCMEYGVCPNCGMPLADELECEYCEWKKIGTSE